MKPKKCTTHSPPLEGSSPKARGVVDTPQAEGLQLPDPTPKPQAKTIIDPPHKPRNSKNYFHLPYNPKLKQRAKKLRKAGNLAEVLLWKQLKHKQFKGLDFDRQKIIGNYIVDFYCANCNVVIEVDGGSHNEKQEYDAKRDQFLENLGLTMIHISDLDVKEQMQATMRYLHDHEAFAGE